MRLLPVAREMAFASGERMTKPESRNGHDKARCGKGQFFAAFAKKLQKNLGHALGSAGFFKDGAHHDAKADDDADAAQGAAKALGDRSDNLAEGHAAHKPRDDGGNDQRREGVNTTVKNKTNQNADANHKASNHLPTAHIHS